jgi:hypothetical protein
MASQFFCILEGKPAGPFSANELKGLAVVGKLSPSDFLRKGKEGKWVPASRHRGLFEATQSGLSPVDREPLIVRDPSRKKDLIKVSLAGVFIGGLIGLLIALSLHGHGRKPEAPIKQQRTLPNEEMHEKRSLVEENGKQAQTRPTLADKSGVQEKTKVQKKAGKSPGSSEDELPLPSKRPRRLPMNRVN